MTEPRHYACAVCRRVINRFRQPDGSITYNHSLEQLIAYDHDPVPRRADRIDGGVIAACDFCAAEDTNCWIRSRS